MKKDVNNLTPEEMAQFLDGVTNSVKLVFDGKLPKPPLPSAEIRSCDGGQESQERALEQL